MSLRPRLQHDRMTVRPVEAGDEEHRYGLLWRIRGPVANESPAARRARELSIAASALAWCPLIGLGVFLARKLLAFDSPGLWLQRLTTREPSLDQLEVSISALKEVLQLEGRLTPEERQVEVMA